MMKRYGITQVVLREKAGVKKGFLSNFLKGENVSKFYSVLGIVRAFDSLANTFHETDLMLKYVMEIIDNRENKPELIQAAMEYCDQNNYLDLQNMLTNLAKSHQNVGLRESGELFKINYFRIHAFRELSKIGNAPLWIQERKHRSELLNLREVAKGYKVIKLENLVYQKLLIAFINSDLQKYNEALFSLKEIDKLIDQIPAKPSKIFYRIKLYEFLQMLYLQKFFDVDSARVYAYKTLEESKSPVIHAMSLTTLAESWMFNDPDYALKYFTEACSIYDQTGLVDMSLLIKMKVQFTQIYWGLDILLQDVIHKQNQAFWLIKNGRNNEGLRILDELEGKGPSNAQQLWLRGLATNNPDYHYLSLNNYVRKKGNRLFGSLPKNSLLHLEENKVAIQSIYNIDGIDSYTY
ncbi:AimR family lysis-lysogeny pheromone receptor [Cytobacillus sp. Hm23]